MSNVLIQNANETTMPYRVAPLGLAWVASALEDAGHQITCLDCPLNTRQWHNWEVQVLQYKPQYVAIGIRNLDNSDMNAFKSYLTAPQRMVNFLRKNLPLTKIILGGSAGTVDPTLVMNEVKADHLILGEGEESCVELIAHLENGQVMPALYSNRDQAFRVAQLSKLSRPRLYERFDMAPYLKSDAGYPVQTKRGCPLHCTYCTYAKIEGRIYRKLEPQKVADEIEGALAKGIRSIEFVDSTFNLPHSHAQAVVDTCLQRGLFADYVGTGINPIKFEKELAISMKTLGFKTVIVTAESASNKMLASYKKNYNKDALSMVGNTLSQANIQAMWVFLLGGPGENKETVEETLQYIEKYIQPPQVVYITSGIRVYPGAPIENDLKNDPSSALLLNENGKNKIPFYFSSDLERNWLSDRLRSFQQKNPHVMLSEQGQGRLVSSIQQVLQWVGAPKPYWKYIHTLGKIRNAMEFNIFSTIYRRITT